MAIKLSGMVSNMDTDSMVQELVSAYTKKKEKVEKSKTKLEWKKEVWQGLNSKIYNFYSKTLSNLKTASKFNKKTVSVSDETKASVTASSTAVKGSQKLEVTGLANSGYLTGAKLANVTDAGGNSVKPTSSTTMADLGIAVDASGNPVDTAFKITVGAKLNPTTGAMEGGTETIVGIKADMKISEVVSAMKKAGVNVNFDEGNGRFYVSSTGTGTDLDFQISATVPGDEIEDPDNPGTMIQAPLTGSSDAISKLGLTGGDSVKLAASDATIKLNDVTYTSNSNSFSINGLTITAKDKTTAPITLVTDTDISGMYDTIKGIITEYNSIINEMSKLYNADTARGYDPLTSEEKEDMSDEEIKKWEDKIKDSLLRRDGTLGDVQSAMKTVMMGSYEINGKTMSLATFGIKTGSFFLTADDEKGAFHIDGDEDDAVSATAKDKLRSMIATDPEAVGSFFGSLVTDMYDTLTKKMSTSKISSAFKVYNDKQMDKEIKEYDKQIKKWENYITEQEDFWYKKFTAMETALSRLQSNASALSGLLGS